ncbi:MAG: hypothetical protein ACR2QF_09175 [Geminicoccaceae bacterium]
MGTLISLSDEELVVLDGSVSEEAQKTVDQAKARLAAIKNMQGVPANIASFIADLVGEAEKSQKLTFRHTRISKCAVCEKRAGFAKFKRDGRYHRAGDSNPKKPLMLPAVELADRNVSIQGRVSNGCCSDCWKDIKPFLSDALNEVSAEIPEAITGYPPKFKRQKNRHCTQCDWEGHEGEMRLLPALFEGRYPGGCPNCDADNKPFGLDLIKNAEGYTLVPVPSKEASK